MPLLDVIFACFATHFEHSHCSVVKMADTDYCTDRNLYLEHGAWFSKCEEWKLTAWYLLSTPITSCCTTKPVKVRSLKKSSAARQSRQVSHKAKVILLRQTKEKNAGKLLHAQLSSSLSDPALKPPLSELAEGYNVALHDQPRGHSSA